MSDRVDQLPVEIVSTLDVNLRQKLEGKARDRSERLRARFHRTLDTATGSTTAGREFESIQGAYSGAKERAVVLGGLEVRMDNASSGLFGVIVTAGAALVKHNPGTLTRPASWGTPAESDDDPIAGVYVLPRDTAVYPSSLPSLNGSGAVNQAEWWAVIVTPSEVAIESDSSRRSVNFDLGTFPTLPADKVFQKRLAVSIVRGGTTNGGTIADVVIPAGSYPIAYILNKPFAAAGLQGSHFFDARAFPVAVGEPNMMIGHWALGRQTFKGWVSARIDGEWVHYRTSRGRDINFESMKDGTAGQFNPAGGIAYLYLCKVAGSPLRYTGMGANSPSGLTSLASVDYSGVLMVSTKPPRGMSSYNNVRQTHYDYEASTEIVGASTYTSDCANMGFNVAQFNRKDCICVGTFPYSTTSDGTTNGHPIVAGTEAASRIACNQDGWIGGEAFGANASKFVSSTSVDLELITGSTGIWSYGAVPVAAGGAMPFVGVALRLFLQAASVGGSGTTNAFVSINDELNESVGEMVPFVNVNGSQRALVRSRMHAIAHGEAIFGRFTIQGTSAPALDPATGINLYGVRFPYGQPLI